MESYLGTNFQNVLLPCIIRKISLSVVVNICFILPSEYIQNYFSNYSALSQTLSNLWYCKFRFLNERKTPRVCCVLIRGRKFIWYWDRSQEFLFQIIGISKGMVLKFVVQCVFRNPSRYFFGNSSRDPFKNVFHDSPKNSFTYSLKKSSNENIFSFPYC